MKTITKAVSALKDTVRIYPGGKFFFRLTSEETNGALAIINVEIMPGNEPPRHCHAREDETNIIRSGEITYFIGDDIVTAKAGDIVFMPRGVPHHFKVTSLRASVRLIVTPGGFENFFAKITKPYNEENVQPIPSAFSNEQIKMIVRTAKEFGVSYIN
jgi:quercetin dioxygenase-like cupin family protein